MDLALLFADMLALLLIVAAALSPSLMRIIWRKGV